MKKLLLLGLCVFCLAVTTPALPASWSEVEGGVAGEAGFIGIGIAGFNGGFAAQGGSVSWTGATEVGIAGGTSGLTAGLGYGEVTGGVKAGAEAFQCAGFANAQAGVLAGSSAVIIGAGIAASHAGGVAGAGAIIK